MKATGIVRRIDDLGRVVIPKEIRRTMRIREGDPLEIYTDRDGEVIFNLLTVSEPKLIEAGKMEVCGKVVEFDPSLEFTFDNPDCTWEETQVLPEHWGIEKFYRIRLRTALKADEEKTFTLAVCK